MKFEVRVTHTSTIPTFPSLGLLTDCFTLTDHLDGTYDCEVEVLSTASDRADASMCA